MLDCLDVARYFLAKSEPDTGDISNLKLQKLLYYAQGHYLALHDRPLFKNPIEAWPHGPVVAAVYHTYKEHGSQPIPPPIDKILPISDHEIREALDIVYAEYGQFSAWKLRNMTHLEPPWQKAHSAGECISLNAMARHFKSQLAIHNIYDLKDIEANSIPLDNLIDQLN